MLIVFLGVQPKMQISLWIEMMLGSHVSDLVHPHLKDVLAPLEAKDILRNLCLPLWVLNIVRRELGLSEMDTPKAIFASNFEKIFHLA